MTHRTVDRLSVAVHQTRAEMGTAASDMVAGLIADEIRRAGQAAVIFASGAATAALLARVSSGCVGVVWDPANAFAEFGERPADGLSALGDRVRHVHLKDARPPTAPAVSPAAPWDPVLVGTGRFPAAEVVALLRGAGFSGFVSFEWEKRWHPSIEEPEVALPHFVRWIREAQSDTSNR